MKVAIARQAVPAEKVFVAAFCVFESKETAANARHECDWAVLKSVPIKGEIRKTEARTARGGPICN